MALVDEGRALRTVLQWQMVATAAAMSIAGIWMGLHGAASALLGGLVTVTAGAAFAWIARGGRKRSAAEALLTFMRAEAAKVALIVVQLLLVVTLYKELVPAAFFITFIVTAIFFSMAFFVRDR